MSPAFSFTSRYNGERTSWKVFYVLQSPISSRIIEAEFGHSEVWMSTDKEHWMQVDNSFIANVPAGIKRVIR
jgi:hypothetical protein